MLLYFESIPKGYRHFTLYIFHFPLFRFIGLFVVVHGQTMFLYAPCCACRSSAPLRGALLSCVDKKVTKEATRGGTEVDPFEAHVVSDPFSSDQNRPPRDLSRQYLVATLFLIVQYSVKFKFIELLCFRKWKIENGKWKMILMKNLYHDMF